MLRKTQLFLEHNTLFCRIRATGQPHSCHILLGANRHPNGVYTLTKKGDERYPTTWVWQAENGCILKGHSWEPGFQIIPGEYNDLNRYIYFVDYNSVEYPSKGYSSYNWTWNDGSSYPQIQGGSVAPQKPEPVEPYWEGYKYIQSENGQWIMGSELVRLSYGSYMPVIGRIYNAMPSMEIGYMDLTEDGRWSCPRNMTSHENEEWLVSANSEYSDRYAWKAFDEDINTVWSTSTLQDKWIQWQNKQRKVLIKELNIYCDDYMQWNTNCYFQGSDDGEVWTDIYRGVFAGLSYDDHEYIDGKCKVMVKVPDNGKPYYYHRIGCTANSTGFARKIEAYSQLPRVVPE